MLSSGQLKTVTLLSQGTTLLSRGTTEVSGVHAWCIVRQSYNVRGPVPPPLTLAQRRHSRQPRPAQRLLMVYWKELGGAPSEGGIAASSSFPSFNEPRFIEPVGPWNQQQSECWKSLALNLQQTWTCTHSTKYFAPTAERLSIFLVSQKTKRLIV